MAHLPQIRLGRTAIVLVCPDVSWEAQCKAHLTLAHLTLVHLTLAHLTPRERACSIC